MACDICACCRSHVQHAIDKAYTLQRHKLERLEEALPQEELARWDMTDGWRIWELYPPIYNCPTKEKVPVLCDNKRTMKPDPS